MSVSLTGYQKIRIMLITFSQHLFRGWYVEDVITVLI